MMKTEELSIVINGVRYYEGDKVNIIVKEDDDMHSGVEDKTGVITFSKYKHDEEADIEPFICQNLVDGASCLDTKGYSYSYVLSFFNKNNSFEDFNVVPFKRKSLKLKLNI